MTINSIKVIEGGGTSEEENKNGLRVTTTTTTKADEEDAQRRIEDSEKETATSPVALYRTHTHTVSIQLIDVYRLYILYK